MSRSIYIRSRKKYKEYTAFLDSWKKKVVPYIRIETSAALSKADASEGLTDIVFDQVNDFLSKTLVFEDYYEERLGQVTSKGFVFDHLYFDSMSIWDRQSLKEFLEKHPDYVLLDETNKEVSFEELFEKK